VAEVGGQHWQQGGDVEAAAMPVEQGVHGEGVAHVVHAGVAVVGAQPEVSGVVPEDLVDLPRRSGRPVTETKNWSQLAARHSRSRAVA
jgi:hypothetical protein